MNGRKTEIIAEIGQNWQGNLQLLGLMIDSAKINGADAVKVQLYDADAIYDPADPWKKWATQVQMSREAFSEAKLYADSIGIELFASVFDEERVAWCEALGVKRYKIASRSIENEDLFKAIQSTGKPVIMSLGMWEGGGVPYIDVDDVSYLYCVAQYPATITLSQLKAVDWSRYHGFSDHTIGINTTANAILMGARIIEKHFTFDHLMYGADHVCSMTPQELNMLNNLRKEVEGC